MSPCTQNVDNTLFRSKRIIPFTLQKLANQTQARRKTAIFQISTNSPIRMEPASF